MDDQLLARTREELGATTHQLAEKEGFDLKYFYNKKKVRQCAEWYISTNEIKGASSSSRGAWGLVSHEEGSGGFSLVGNILPTHLSFKTRCWKRTWRAQRTGFYWPARWCCSCFGGGMNGDGQECFRVLITSFWGFCWQKLWRRWKVDVWFAQKLDKAATAVDDSDRMRKVKLKSKFGQIALCIHLKW